MENATFHEAVDEKNEFIACGALVAAPLIGMFHCIVQHEVGNRVTSPSLSFTVAFCSTIFVFIDFTAFTARQSHATARSHPEAISAQRQSLVSVMASVR